MSQLLIEGLSLAGWIALGVSIVAAAVLVVQEAVRCFRSQFDDRSIRAALRSLKQFRLRTLLLVVAAFQVALTIGLSLHREGKPASIICMWLVGLTFLAWVIWTCFAESIDATASRRWKRFVRPRRIAIPPDENEQSDRKH